MRVPLYLEDRRLRHGLASAWHLDEDSGTRYDAIGNNNLTDVNTVTSNPGVYGNAAQFVKNNTEYLTIASNATLQAGDIHLAMASWVRFDSVTGQSFHVIQSKWHGTGLNSEYTIWHRSSDNQIRFSVRNPADTSTTEVVATNFGGIPTGAWLFVVAQHDFERDQVSISINAGSPNVASHAEGIRSSNEDFRIGGWGTTGINPFDGRIDEFLLYKDRLLSQEDILKLYRSGLGRFLGKDF